ncbi:hypothetical protein PoB_003048100 [Plakobranchus ocellatus]|uniref:Uncharacterized protein n=1 Tax=Plakobranchus ocellatus TaxID=259542 RepID=A0AAV4ABF0_9GAST|nr:hypothetical protein PoB_003048100 [Plakobranchus ocellatus]
MFKTFSGTFAKHKTYTANYINMITGTASSFSHNPLASRRRRDFSRTRLRRLIASTLTEHVSSAAGAPVRMLITWALRDQSLPNKLFKINLSNIFHNSCGMRMRESQYLPQC